MTPKEAHDIYRAVWLHFRKNGTYDYFKYDGRVRGKKVEDGAPEWAFTVLTREFSESDFPFYLAFMFYKNPRIQIAELRSKEHWNEWKKWKERQKNRVQYLNDELKLIKPADLEYNPNEYPGLFNKIDNLVSLDAFIIIDSVLQLTKKWEAKLKNDFAYTSWLKHYRKWRAFFYAYIPYDRNTFQTIVEKELT